LSARFAKTFAVMLPDITLTPFHYQAQECIGLVCVLDRELELVICKINCVNGLGKTASTCH
jgi:hypothetical protein